jgi:hypothetical protein
MQIQRHGADEKVEKEKEYGKEHHKGTLVRKRYKRKGRVTVGLLCTERDMAF